MGQDTTGAAGGRRGRPGLNQQGQHMKSNAILIASPLVGIACGLVSHLSFLEGKWLNLVLWGVVGVVLGLFASGRRQVVWAGVLFGFCMTVVFLISGFQGNPNQLPAFLVLTLVLSVVGVAGGLVSVFVGSRLRGILH
jgi:hypothetical protein